MRAKLPATQRSQMNNLSHTIQCNDSHCDNDSDRHRSAIGIALHAIADFPTPDSVFGNKRHLADGVFKRCVIS